MPHKKEGLLIDFKYKKIITGMTDEQAGSWLKAMKVKKKSALADLLK